MDEIRFRFPDDPKRVSIKRIQQIDTMPKGKWLAQVKVDDWRRPAYKVNGKWVFGSKYGGAEAAIQPPADLVAELESLQLPDGTAIDCGWMGRRCVDELKGKHYLVLFDLLYHDGDWMGNLPFGERHGDLRTILELSRAAYSVEAPRIKLSRTWDSGFEELFEKQKADPLSEGLVLRRADSKLIGDFRSRQKNPLWIKVKYRDIKEATAY